MAIVFDKLVFDEVKNIDVLFLGINLASVDPKEQVPHGVIVDEGLEAITCQVKVFALVVLYKLLLGVSMFE